MVPCKKSREALLRLPRGPRGIVSRPSLEANGAVAGVSGGPCGKITKTGMCVKKAERVLQLFYFEEKEVRKIKKRMYMDEVAVCCSCLSPVTLFAMK